TNFKDINQHWAFEEVKALEAKGWLKAEEHDQLMLYPDDGMPRQEMARLVTRAANLDTINGNTGFQDNNSIPAAFRPYINAAVKNNLIKGYPDGTFRPTGTLTRAEAA